MLETVFNAPTKQVVRNHSFGRGTEIIGNKDMVLVVVILIPLAKYDYRLLTGSGLQPEPLVLIVQRRRIGNNVFKKYKT